MPERIPRHFLPQIPSEKYDEFRKFLRDNGVQTQLTKVPVKNLRPIQSEFNRDKVESLKKSPEKLSNPVIVSITNLILDGLHRVIADFELHPDGNILAIVANCGMYKLLELGHEFDGSYTKTVNEWNKAALQEIEEEEKKELLVRKSLKWY